MEILRSGGTAATALQSMLAIVVSLRYQEHRFIESHILPSLDRIVVRCADFIAVQIPRGREQLADRAAGMMWPFNCGDGRDIAAQHDCY